MQDKFLKKLTMLFLFFILISNSNCVTTGTSYLMHKAEVKDETCTVSTIAQLTDYGIAYYLVHTGPQAIGAFGIVYGLSLFLSRNCGFSNYLKFWLGL